MNIVRNKLGENDILDLPSDIQGKSYKIWISNGEPHGKCGDTILFIKLEASPEIVIDEPSFVGGEIAFEVYETYGKKHVKFSNA